MIRCPAITRRKWRIKTISTLRKRMKQLDTKYDLENTLACAIAQWFKTGHVPLYKYPENFHEAIWSQGVIAWRQIFNAKISRHWLKHQGNTKKSSGRVRMDYIWGASIVETCLRMRIDLWKMRKEEVYGKEEVTKQQKRKAKAAISVRDLHKLHEIARPSDSILFYQNVEKEIEQGTTAKLEGSIAMKSKPIHNSVKKWADRSISGAKSVVGWFRTGEKKNNEKNRKSRKTTGRPF